MGEARRKKLLYGPPVKTPKSVPSPPKLLNRAELDDLVKRMLEELAVEERMTKEEAYVPPDEMEMIFQEEAHANRTAALGSCGCQGVQALSCFVDLE